MSFDTHSTANLSLPILKKNQVFFQKKFSYVFEKSYYFSRILRQLCYNLVMKNFQIQNVGCPDYWQVNVREMFAMRGSFSLQIINMAQKQYCRSVFWMKQTNQEKAMGQYEMAFYKKTVEKENWDQGKVAVPKLRNIHNVFLILSNFQIRKI